jgi:hypothetical protein
MAAEMHALALSFSRDSAMRHGRAKAQLEPADVESAQLLNVSAQPLAAGRTLSTRTQVCARAQPAGAIKFGTEAVQASVDGSEAKSPYNWLVAVKGHG